jgi:hypothetical protein
MGLALEARLFLRQLLELKRLALNAQILAATVTEGSEVFQTLAREIARLADDADHIIRALQAHAHDVAGKAMRSAALARVCERYEAALACGVTRGTRERIAAVRGGHGEVMMAEVTAMYDQLAKTGQSLGELARMHIQLPMIATMLNIEANRSSDADPALAESAQSLRRVKKEIGALLERIEARFCQTLKELCLIAKEGPC